MNFTTRTFSPALRAASAQLARRTSIAAACVAILPMRTFSSFGEESPLDDFLKPGAPTPLYGKVEWQPRPVTTKKLECGVDEAHLRFKTKCYGRLMLPPFVHPNEHKIVMTVPIHHLNLSPLERDILKEIVGSGRWHEDRGELRLQSVSFGSRIENKRHLVSMLDRLVLSCQRLAAEVQDQAGEEATAA
uniref:Small ribosomal subunit protein mS35 mitochondrial conserved domain-containing protein n=1 Tax=Amphora coffeiformis TaxID=265554 RepID=A0A7S3P4S3_9STRA|mmetsp:Transcript_9691/g.18544  ORF Transcript_9691/g.18544 Transcript_9691/m.18544 type:complete len:189 (-) Transcript_9691:204-770(-)